MSRTLPWAGAFVAAWVVAGCGTGDLRPSTSLLSLGTWGGENSGVIVTDSEVHVHVGCTYGDIPGQVTIGADGRFTADGTYILKAFPIVLGPRLPAHFSGRLVGRVLSMSVAVNDTTTGKIVALGPISVRYGQDPAMGPCPICRVPPP